VACRCETCKWIDPRPSGPSERARTNIWHAINTAVRKIARTDPELGAHIKRCVRCEDGKWSYGPGDEETVRMRRIKLHD
jgi:hypothetical protein